MTLHELAEGLRKVAYDLDGANEKWDANDRHVLFLDARVASLSSQLRVTGNALADARKKLERKRPKRRTSPKRRPAKKGKR